MERIARDFAPLVFVFGFGKHCASEKLRTMAVLAGGEYYEGITGLELKSQFEEVSAKVSSMSF